jgi:hypothetical protein
MNREQHQKVTPQHLKRAALLYVRQSTMRQVFKNTESTKRQYALRERAVALGWPHDEIVVIDGDLPNNSRSHTRDAGTPRFKPSPHLAQTTCRLKQGNRQRQSSQRAPCDGELLLEQAVQASGEIRRIDRAGRVAAE